MIITAIQAILIAFAIGVIVGGFIGWKLTFNMRLVRLQEQQVAINKLKHENAEYRSKIRSYNIQKTKDKASNAAVAVGNAALITGSAVGNAAVAVGNAAMATGSATGNAVAAAAANIKQKIWPKKDSKTEENQK